jgi:arsenite methyltransferase
VDAVTNKAKMFNKKASDPKSKPDHILETLALQPDQTIGDIGAGGGYFSLRFADAVGKNCMVYAIDTNPEFLEFIMNTANEKGLSNIKTVLVKEDKLILPKKSLDIIFLRNVYHHLPNRVKFFKNLKEFLKPEHKIVIIEYKRGGPFSFQRIFGHYVLKETIVKEMEESGYQLKNDYDFLPKQSFTVFSLRN